MAVRQDSVLGTLRFVLKNYYNYCCLFWTPYAEEREACNSRGVRYQEFYLGRRTLLPFVTDRETAIFLTGHKGFKTDYVYLCICAASPTTGARCASSDFFFCVSETPSYESVEIVAMLRLKVFEGGSVFTLEFPPDIVDVIMRIYNERIEARAAAKEARLILQV